MSDWSFSNSEMPTIRLTEAQKMVDESYQQGRADAIKPFKDIYIHNIALDYERPTMPMLMNFWNEFSKLTKE